MTQAAVQREQELEKILGAGKARSGKRKALISFVALLLLLIAAGFFYLRARISGTGITYQTGNVRRANLLITVSATGNLQPTNQVDVGSELSGIIESVFVEENDHVKKGQPLARLDTSKLQDQIVRSRSTLAAANAKVEQAKATQLEAKANLDRLQKVHELSSGKVPSAAEFDQAKAAYARAVADEASARASVQEASAALRSDETNFSKASIRSPIDGIVLSREVEPGQTVAASLQAPVLFTVAENLTQMELQVEVDEADVGEVRAGQSATFTVDAYPGRRYRANVSRVSYGSKTNEGVVSYLTTLTVNNDDLSLRPGMTASAQIKTAERQNVLTVPNAALKYSPQNFNRVLPRTSGANRETLVQKLMPRPPRGAPSRVNGRKPNDAVRRVWILRDRKPVPVPVEVGLSDGKSTEITSGELQEGIQIITGDQTSSK